ncbi:MAG: YcgL domain-containing protein [Gammaproteobacteria bacterium]|nr:YcgL domain-containing protein [Gammaproteobacteria bacterium]
MDCVIYKGHKQPDSYLYVRAGEAPLDGVPETLVRILGRLEEVMRLELHPERRLAQADVTRVLADIESQRYYLQMPPRHPAVGDQGLSA